MTESEMWIERECVREIQRMSVAKFTGSSPASEG